MSSRHDSHVHERAVGPDELAQGKALVKNMRGGEQRALTFAELQFSDVFAG